MPPAKIRSGYKKHEPYPLNQFPVSIIEGFAKRIVHLKAVGHADMSGDIFCQMFADTVSGQAYGNPLGVADVAWNGCAWSVKTVKNSHPHRFEVGGTENSKRKRIRLISGRNSPHYSAGITDPIADVQATGNAVLDIYNSRVDEAREEHDDVRLLVFIRNMVTQEFTVFERTLTPLAVNDYQWSLNNQGNLEGRTDNNHVFTWQPHGSQFTIIEPIPDSATRFRINRQPPMLQMTHVLRLARFEQNWVEII